MKFQIDPGGSGTDPDQHALAQLLEALERVCQASANPGCRCDDCPPGETDSCRRLLKDICGRIQVLLLDHFQREQELMNSLPRNAATKIHCERHRREHVSFSTRYNVAAAALNDCRPAAGARTLEALVLDWIRGHALTFDVELAALLNRSIDDRRRYA